MIADCLGCLSYVEDEDSIPCLSEFSDECPCSVCIIKMICGDSCEPFNDFRRKYIRTYYDSGRDTNVSKSIL